MLVLLDLFSTFDTVDHGILLERLRVTFGVDNSALAWFRSYLAGRRQHVRCGGGWQVLCSHRRHLQHATRVGPRADTLCYLHRRLGVDRHGTWFVTAPVR